MAAAAAGSEATMMAAAATQLLPLSPSSAAVQVEAS